MTIIPPGDMNAPVLPRVERLEFEVVDLKAGRDSAVDARMETHRREWRRELDDRFAAHHAEVDDKLKAHGKLIDAKVEGAQTAIIAEVQATRAAVQARREVPAWMTMTPFQLGQYAAVFLSVLTTAVGVVGPLVLSAIATCQGNPTEYRVPIPQPLQLSPPVDDAPPGQ